MTDEERARALKKRLCGDSTDCDERTKTILAAFTAVREEEWRDSQLIRLAPVLLNEFGASEALPGISTAIYTLRALRERAERAEAERDEARAWLLAIADLLTGEPLSDFALSEPVVRGVADVVAERDALNAEKDAIDEDRHRFFDSWQEEIKKREQAEAERDAARADNARLREALALALDAVDAVCNYFGNAGDAERVTLYKEQTARARALTGGPR